MPIPRYRLWPFLLALALIVSAIGGRVAFAVDASEQGRAGVLGVPEARAEIDLIQGQLDQTTIEIDSLGDELSGLELRTAELSADQAHLVTEVETSIKQNRELVVAAFITGGEAESQRLLASNQAADYQWQTYLLRSESVQASGVADRLSALRAVTDGEILELAEQLDSGKARLSVAEQRRLELSADLAVAETHLIVAAAWELSDRAVARGRYGEAPPEAWARLRFCESSGNYAAVDRTGVYRGAYQFDRQTWRTVGGVGDPVHASALEQDARARALYALRGNQPWPVCGHHLP